MIHSKIFTVYRKINSLKYNTNKYLRFFSVEEQKSFLLFYDPTFNKKYCIKLDIINQLFPTSILFFTQDETAF